MNRLEGRYIIAQKVHVVLEETQMLKQHFEKAAEKEKAKIWKDKKYKPSRWCEMFIYSSCLVSIHSLSIW